MTELGGEVNTQPQRTEALHGDQLLPAAACPGGNMGGNDPELPKEPHKLPEWFVS